MCNFKTNFKLAIFPKKTDYVWSTWFTFVTFMSVRAGSKWLARLLVWDAILCLTTNRHATQTIKTSKLKLVSKWVSLNNWNSSFSYNLEGYRTFTGEKETLSSNFHNTSKTVKKHIVQGYFHLEIWWDITMVKKDGRYFVHHRFSYIQTWSKLSFVMKSKNTENIHHKDSITPL